MKLLLGLVLVSVVVLAVGPGHADDIANNALEKFCQENLTNIQGDRRICVIGIVQDTIHVRVLVATKPKIVDQIVKVYRSPPQASAQNPLSDLTQNVGHVVAVGGFENLPAIYSAKRL